MEPNCPRHTFQQDVAHELELAARDLPLTPDEVFKAVAAVHRRLKGSYAVVALIAYRMFGQEDAE